MILRIAGSLPVQRLQPVSPAAQQGWCCRQPSAKCSQLVYTAQPICRHTIRGPEHVSKQDTHFLNVFSMVIGLLVVVAILIFALARVVASATQDKQVLEEKQYTEGVDQRLSRAGREAIAGHDNSALAIKADAGNGQGGAGSAAPELKSGAEVFQQVCSACHGAGVAGAPKAGDKAAWAPRIAKGNATLYEHALKGFQGSSGVMPAKGGRADLSDDLVKQAVDHMVSLAK